MRTRALSWAPLALLVGAAIAGCRESIAPPTPGPVVASLVTPAHDDGAVLVTLTGTTFTDITAASAGYTIYSRVVSATEVRVIVLGNLSAGPLFTAQVPDRRAVHDLSATLQDVANRADAIQPSRTGYAVALTAAGQD